jgi:2-desacetyl-2-hydroxyethyl bacteriochlorophyllide A dehydrogenase
VLKEDELKGVVFLGDQKLEIQEIPKPEPGEGEVLIEMKASGICGSDLSAYNVPGTEVTEESRSVIRGHEPCGLVVALGPGTRNVKVGDRVMIHHYKGCGKCKHCLSGWAQLCVHGAKAYGWALNGGHEDYMVCSDTTCVPMPDELTYEEGACCTCGTGTAFQALKRLAVSGIDTVAVFGQGPVGLSAAIFAKAMGARVIAIDTVAGRLETSAQLGADEIVNSSKVDAVDAIREMTKGEGADVTIDCAGAEEARINALKSAKVWGRVCFIGEKGVPATFNVFQLFILKQLTVHGSWTFSTHVLSELADFVVDHKVKLDKIISHRFPLSDADEAYKRFARGEIDKAVFVWQ